MIRSMTSPRSGTSSADTRSVRYGCRRAPVPPCPLGYRPRIRRRCGQRRPGPPGCRNGASGSYARPARHGLAGLPTRRSRCAAIPGVRVERPKSTRSPGPGSIAGGQDPSVTSLSPIDAAISAPFPASSASMKFIAGLPDEAGHEDVGRLAIERLWGVVLLERAFREYGDAVPERHRLHLIVGDMDRGHAQAFVEAPQLGAQLHPQFRVQVGERLVEQERTRMAHDRPPHGHPLPLAAESCFGLRSSSWSRSRMRAASFTRSAISAWRNFRTRAQRRCSGARSCADRARNSERPWPCFARAAKHR